MPFREEVSIDQGFRGFLAAAGLDSVSSMFALEKGVVVTRSGSTEVRRIEVTDEKGLTRTLFLKKYWISRRKQLWSGMFRGVFFGQSKVRREFENLRGLRESGVGAPWPVAFGEERRSGWLIRSYLLTEGIPEPVPLDLLIRDEWSRHSIEERRRLLDSLADAICRMHQRGFFHGDLHWRNILLSRKDRFGERFYLIDSHRGRVTRSIALFWEDLACLDAPASAFLSRTDRLRFFLRYSGARKLDGDGRAAIRGILQRAEPLRRSQTDRVLLRGKGRG